MVRRSDPENEILIFTSGQMMKKVGKKQQQDFAGCAVIYMPKGNDSGHRSDCIGFSIEDRGPNGEFFNPESKRADLRAVVAALEFKIWSSEGWSKVTIASDSRYVCEGITQHIVGWRKKGWLDGTAHHGRTWMIRVAPSIASRWCSQRFFRLKFQVLQHMKWRAKVYFNGVQHTFFA